MATLALFSGSHWPNLEGENRQSRFLFLTWSLWARSSALPMLTGPQSAETLAGILAGFESFTAQNEELIEELELGTMSIAPTTEKWAAFE